MAWVRARGSTPFATAVHSSGRYLVDQYGAPFLLRSDSQWNLLCWGGGRSELGGGTTPQGVFAGYAATRAAKGFNACLVIAVNSNAGGEVGPYLDGRTWDGVSPWGGGGIGDLNEAYWGRVDDMVDALAAEGITTILQVFSAYSLYPGAAFDGLDSTSAATLGTALGNRYKDRPGLVWAVGNDYFATIETELAAWLSALRAAGDGHLVFVEYNAETTSTNDSQGGGAQGSFGASSDVQDVYTYNAPYQVVEIAYGESGPKPALFMNGHYDQSGTGSSDRRLMNDMLGWALTSGSAGFQYGSEGTWQWGVGAYAAVGNETWSNGDFPAVMDRIAALDGWQDLVPDIDGGLGFITSGRGAKVSAIAPGGGNGEYSSGNVYKTGAVTADGRLGLIYTPDSSGFPLTVDTAQLAGGFTATWLDPVSGDLTPTTPGSSYSHPGNNDGGDPGWYLVLEG